MSADGTIPWILEIFVRKRSILSQQVRNPLLRRNPRTACPVLDCGGWQEPLSLLELSATPSQGGCPEITPTGALYPLSCPALGFSCCSRQPASYPEGWRPSPGAWRLQAAPPCALWAGPAPLLTSLLATAGMPSPPSVYFLSGWGPGSWKPCSYPLPIPLFGGPSSLGLKPERRLWSGEGSQLTAQSSCGEEKLCCGWAPWGPLQKLSDLPFHLP